MSITDWRDLKDQGRESFGRADYNEALRLYLESIDQLTSQSDARTNDEHQVLLSNVVACRLKLGGQAQVEKAVEDAQKVSERMSQELELELWGMMNSLLGPCYRSASRSPWSGAHGDEINSQAPDLHVDVLPKDLAEMPPTHFLPPDSVHFTERQVAQGTRPSSIGLHCPRGPLQRRMPIPPEGTVARQKQRCRTPNAGDRNAAAQHSRERVQSRRTEF